MVYILLYKTRKSRILPAQRESTNGIFLEKFEFIYQGDTTSPPYWRATLKLAAG